MKEKIRIGEIEPAPWNARSEISEESVRGLADSIREVGLIHPIALWESPDGRTYCVAGNRRLAALRLAFGADWEIAEEDYAEVDGDEDEARMVTVVENLQRSDIGVLEEAALVGEFLDGGMDAREIAAKTGRSVAWVNRRRKLLALDEAWKARAGELTADALERIAAYPAAVQKRVAKSAAGSRWAELKGRFERESRDLDGVKFDTAECRGCPKRTGAEGDLFGVVEGSLGSCLSCDCFERKRAAWVEAKVSAATKGAAEVVRVNYAWSLPEEDGSSAVRTAKHPCAYCFADPMTGEVTVRWGESKAAADERLERERAEAGALDAARQAERVRIVATLNKITEAVEGKPDGEGANDTREAIAAEIGRHIRCETAAAAAILVRAILDWVAYADGATAADACRALPALPRLAGVTDEELGELLSAYPAASGEG